MRENKFPVNTTIAVQFQRGCMALRGSQNK